MLHDVPRKMCILIKILLSPLKQLRIGNDYVKQYNICVIEKKFITYTNCSHKKKYSYVRFFFFFDFREHSAACGRLKFTFYVALTIISVHIILLAYKQNT